VRTAGAILLALVLGGVAPASAAGQYPDAVRSTSGLAGYWRLGDTSGTAASEASGRAAAGTYAGAPALGARGALHADPDASCASTAPMTSSRSAAARRRRSRAGSSGRRASR
jgi:hypothetical protein